MVYWETQPDAEALDAALDATQRALEIDDHNAVFHMLRGRVQLARREYAAPWSRTGGRSSSIRHSPPPTGAGRLAELRGPLRRGDHPVARSVALGAHDPQRWAFLSYGVLALMFAERYDEASSGPIAAASLPNCQYWTTAHLSSP